MKGLPPSTATVRVPPQDLEAEQSVLGAMFMSERAIHEVSAIIRTEDFYRETHRHIYVAIMNLTSKGNPVDVITVTNELQRMGEWEKTGGVLELTQLIERVPTAANAEYYAQIVRDHSDRRQIIRQANEAASDAYELQKHPNEIQESLVSQIVNHQNFSQMIEPHQMAVQAFEMVADPKRVLYIPTGYAHFDEKIKGIKRGVVTTVTGESEVGKSTFMQNVALDMARRKGADKVKVIYIYLEDSPYQIAKRQVCMMQNWPIDRVESTDPKVLDFQMKARAFSEWGDLGIKVWSRKQTSLQWKTLKLWILREVKKNTPDVFFIDGCERLQNNVGYGESRYDAQERMVGEMEDVALNLEVALVAIVGQAKTSKMAKSQNIIDENEGGTNAWRKLARMRLLVKRHEKADVDREFDNVGIVKVTKNSDGDKGEFWFRGNRSTYVWKEIEY